MDPLFAGFAVDRRLYRRALADGTQKVTTAVKFRCTVFIEGDLQQAVLISERAPLLKVVWWDVTSRSGKLVGAQSWKSPPQSA